ncbi:MAG TPA: FAD-dependent oxidoreductase, partial [Acidimicrobiales bacterium]|nr:FAD-dependent oxidoreductase [Acidimicrobiales bacterium]
MSAFTDTTYRSYWLDDPKAPTPRPPLLKDLHCDLAVVGAGFTGLWSALLAAERFPGREIVVVEQRSAGWAASGRNGGFLEASLTHGIANGAARFPEELARLEALGLENLQEIEETVEKEGIDCQLERNGTISVATADWQIAELEEAAELSRRYGQDVELLDAEALGALVRSPTYL